MSDLKKLIAAVDFDGVIYSYQTGYQGVATLPDPPVKNAKSCIQKLVDDDYYVMIFSTRASNVLGRRAIEQYLHKYDIPFHEVYMGFGKPFANVYLDDRAIQFTGDWELAYKQIKDFKTWNEKIGNKELNKDDEIDLLKELENLYPKNDK